MNKLEKFFEENKFTFFHYRKEHLKIALKKRDDNSNDHLIFDELKLIVDALMGLPLDFKILDNGDIELEEL